MERPARVKQYQPLFCVCDLEEQLPAAKAIALGAWVVEIEGREPTKQKRSPDQFATEDWFAKSTKSELCTFSNICG